MKVTLFARHVATPLLSLSSDKKKVRKAVEAYKRREVDKKTEKPVKITSSMKRPYTEPIKPAPIKIRPGQGSMNPVQEKQTSQWPISTRSAPSTDKKSGKTKVIAAAVAGVVCVGIIIGLFSRGKSYDIGDIVTFGSYEQDNNLNNGEEEIEWIVLDKNEEGYLLISKYGLDAKPYNVDYVDVTWENSTLRSWLNEDFYINAFESKERQKVRTTHIVAAKNPEYDTEPGNGTDDPVFLLSIQEAEKYFDNREARKAYPTEYAKANGAYEYSSTKCCWWWLRSPGDFSNYAAYVSSAGWVSRGGNVVRSATGCVRPALWVNL